MQINCKKPRSMKLPENHSSQIVLLKVAHFGWHQWWDERDVSATNMHPFEYKQGRTNRWTHAYRASLSLSSGTLWTGYDTLLSVGET